MLASLPMYDRPELIDAHARYWWAIRRELTEVGIDAPNELTRGIEDLLGHWRSPDLVLSQTCGMPYRRKLHGTVTLVGTPDYGVADCPAGYYRSVFVVRAEDGRDELADFDRARFAFNERLSQSGYSAPRTHVESMGFWFAEQIESGGHLSSVALVVSEKADIASIDAVTWRLFERHDPLASKLRIVDVTQPTPGLPYISGLDIDGELVFGAVERAIGELSPQDRDLLGLHALIAIPAQDYLAIPTPED